MQYTGNGNKILWYVVVPLLLIFYVLFILWSDRAYINLPVYEAVRNKQSELQKLEGVRGVILGGSNAWWGISARSLSSLSGLTWANLAIPAEGYSDDNYEGFISETLSAEKRSNVSYVIYSAATLVRNDYAQRKKSRTDLYGKNQLSYRPQRSLASNIKNYLGLTGYRPYPVENEYGDFGFGDYPCAPFEASPYIPREYLNRSELPDWVADQLERISLLFPNATIFIYVPNGFNAHMIEDNNHLRELLISELRTLLLFRETRGGGVVHLLSQNPYKSSDLMCADDWHANDQGRAWRTTELYQLIRDQLPKQ